MKVILFANTDWYLFNFRLSLAHALRESGAEVVMLAPSGPYVSRLSEEGFRFVQVSMERRSLNPIRELHLLYELAKIYRDERPDVVHHFTIKCVVYGSIVAQALGIERRVNAIAGLGHVFSSGRLLARLLKPFVRVALRVALRGRRARVILQNSDDLCALRKMGVVDIDRARVILGSGVDTQRFRPRDRQVGDRDAFRVLMASRLLWDKGIAEYAGASKLLRGEGLNIEFQLAGTTDTGNPTAVPQAVIDEWARQRVLIVLGHVDDMAEKLREVDLVVLPTAYGEGVPKILVEAAASGLPLVATDSPGCREIVVHGVNGLLVRPKDTESLANAIRRLADDDDLRAQMGQLGRKRVLDSFDQSIVIRRTLEVYDECRMAS